MKFKLDREECLSGVREIDDDLINSTWYWNKGRSVHYTMYLKLVVWESLSDLRDAAKQSLIPTDGEIRQLSLDPRSSLWDREHSGSSVGHRELRVLSYTRSRKKVSLRQVGSWEFSIIQWAEKSSRLDGERVKGSLQSEYKGFFSRREVIKNGILLEEE